MSEQPSMFLQSFILDGKGGGRRIDDDAVRKWTPEDGVLWAHFDIGDPDAGEWLTNDSGLPRTAIDTLLAGETRPRSMAYEDGLLIVLRGVNTNPGSDPEDMVAIRIWLERDRIISTRRRRLLSVLDVAGALDQGAGPATPGSFLVDLTERLADRIGEFVGSIEERLDAAEDEISHERSPGFRQRLGALRRQIAEVRRFLAPQRDALDRLNRQSSGQVSEAESHELRQEADRITRFLEDLDLARERTVVLQEELLSQIAQEQNTRMYVLSVVAAVFLPLTFVTGLLGMNVGGLPGLENPSGFAWSMLIMVIAAVGLLVFFRFKKWL